MKKTLHKILSLLLAVLLAAVGLPMMATAASGDKVTFDDIYFEMTVSASSILPEPETLIDLEVYPTGSDRNNRPEQEITLEPGNYHVRITSDENQYSWGIDISAEEIVDRIKSQGFSSHGTVARPFPSTDDFELEVTFEPEGSVPDTAIVDAEVERNGEATAKVSFYANIDEGADFYVAATDNKLTENIMESIHAAGKLVRVDERGNASVDIDVTASSKYVYIATGSDDDWVWLYLPEWGGDPSDEPPSPDDYFTSSMVWVEDENQTVTGVAGVDLQFNGLHGDISWDDLDNFVLIKDGEELPVTRDYFSSNITKDYQYASETMPARTHYLFDFETWISDPGKYTMSLTYMGKKCTTPRSITVGENSGEEPDEPIKLPPPGNPLWEDDNGTAGWDPIVIPGEEGAYDAVIYELNLYVNGREYFSTNSAIGGMNSDRFNTHLTDKFRPDGTYYFEVRATGDGVHYSTSDWVRSDDFEFKAPAEQLGKATNLRFKNHGTGENPEYVPTWDEPDNAGENDYYSVNLLKDGVNVGGSRFDTTTGGEEPWIAERIKEEGSGVFTFQVMAMTSRITEIRSGEWSDLSEPLTIGDGATDPKPTEPDPDPKPTEPDPDPKPTEPDPDTDLEPDTDPENNNDHPSFVPSGDNDGGNDSRRDTSSGSAITAPKVGTSVTVSSAIANAAVAAALGSATNGSATAKLKNPGDIALATLQSMAQQAGDTSLKVNADSMFGNGVDVRITLDPSQATSDLDLSGSTQSTATKNVRSFFERHFTNDIMIVTLGHQGSFGMSVQIAAKLDPTLDTANLVFYSYDSTSNTYNRIAAPAYWVDANGYVHFTTALGGSIVISNGVLERK